MNSDQTLIVIPVYNHGNTLQDVAQKAVATGLSVLVVDDGSTDGGQKSLLNIDCEVITMPENRGKGAAILAGARYAVENSFHAILTVDADGQHDPADGLKLIKKARDLASPGIVIGAREMVQDTVPKSSLFGRNFSNFWIKLECGVEIEDSQSGLRLYPARELLELNLRRKRYDFEVEVLVKAAWAGLEICSVAVSVHYPPADERVSHFNKLVDNWRLSWLHTRLIFRRLLPFSHEKLVAEKSNQSKLVVAKSPLKTLKNLCLENSSPFWLAVAVWMGLFLGALPLIACHTIVIIYVTYRLHLNKVAAVAASQFCMPPVVPVLCIEVGYYLRYGSFIVDLSWQRWLLEIHHRLFEWLLGSLIVGPLLGMLGGAIVYFTSRHVQQRMNKQSGMEQCLEDDGFSD